MGEKIGVVSETKDGLLRSYDYNRMFPKLINNFRSDNAFNIISSPSNWASCYAHVFGAIESSLIDIQISFQLRDSVAYVQAKGIIVGYIVLYYDKDGVYIYGNDMSKRNKSLWVEGTNTITKIETADISKWEKIEVSPY